AARPAPRAGTHRRAGGGLGRRPAGGCRRLPRAARRDGIVPGAARAARGGGRRGPARRLGALPQGARPSLRDRAGRCDADRFTRAGADRRAVAPDAADRDRRRGRTRATRARDRAGRGRDRPRHREARQSEVRRARAGGHRGAGTRAARRLRVAAGEAARAARAPGLAAGKPARAPPPAGGPGEPAAERGALLSSAPYLARSRAEIDELTSSGLEGFLLRDVVGKAACDVELHAIEYQTIGGAGEPVNATGGVAI